MGESVKGKQIFELNKCRLLFNSYTTNLLPSLPSPLDWGKIRKMCVCLVVIEEYSSHILSLAYLSHGIYFIISEQEFPLIQVSGPFSSLAEKPLLWASSGASRPPLNLFWRPFWFSFLLFFVSFLFQPTYLWKSTPTCFSFFISFWTHTILNISICVNYLLLLKQNKTKQKFQKLVAQNSICFIHKSTVEHSHSWAQLGEAAHFVCMWHLLDWPEPGNGNHLKAFKYSRLAVEVGFWLAR